MICWTERGLIKGGTGQALCIANAFVVPVINLGTQRWRDIRPERLVREILLFAGGLAPSGHAEDYVVLP